MHRSLFGLQEVADLFGVSKQAFSQRFKQDFWRWGNPKVIFPDPAYTVSAGRFWTWEQMDEYIRQRQRNNALTWKESKELQTARGKLESIGQIEMKMDGSV